MGCTSGTLPAHSRSTFDLAEPTDEVGRLPGPEWARFRIIHSAIRYQSSHIKRGEWRIGGLEVWQVWMFWRFESFSRFGGFGGLEVLEVLVVKK